MSIFPKNLPLALYVHLPWCVKKCPYCDFNSHALKNNLPEDQYINILLQELADQLPLVNNRPLMSIFLGGGTPSLFSPSAIAKLLQGIDTLIDITPHLEITMEANPGTIDQANFYAYRLAGINRLSLGIQSFQNDKLQALGRIHDANQAQIAIATAKAAGFTNINLDIMYGLPGQSQADALADLEQALAHEPSHFSWYQLTIEPNTLFHHVPPPLPNDETIWAIQVAGSKIIKTHGYQQYEVSAYAKPGKICQHNHNYWQFGDYLGIGAGAHSKITMPTQQVIRFAQVKHPQHYLTARKRVTGTERILSTKELIFEFMLNALRLTDGVPSTLFTERTGLPLSCLQAVRAQAQKRGLLHDNPHLLRATDLGYRYLNDLTSLFL